jgi:putative DNA primase/helicase
MSASDDGVASHPGEQAIRDAAANAEALPPSKAPLRGAKRDPLACLWDCELWRSPAGVAYASVPIGDHVENLPINSSAFRLWARHTADVRTALQVNSDALERFVALAQARATFSEGVPVYEVCQRVGAHGDRIYLDLGDATWRAVEIAPAVDDRDVHWRVIPSADVPVKFLRTGGMKALPEPAPGGSIDELRPFVNVAGDADFMLMVSWLVCALRPRPPYPILAVAGEQGSGKTGTLRLLRRLVDPTLAPERAAPMSERDLFVGAVNGWCLSFDNLSSVPDWLSDAMCRISTGGGFASRMLHSDAEEVVLSAARPLLINGIPTLARRADLADRSIVIALPSLGDRRRTEQEFWEDFETAAPMILGALCQLLAFALCHAPELAAPPGLRMADAARWAVAAGIGAGWAPNAIVEAWTANRHEAIAEVIEHDSVAAAIVRLLEGEATYNGTAAALLDRLDNLVTDTVKRSRHWPSSPAALGTRLQRITPALRSLGYTVEKGKGGPDSKRYVRLARPE